MKKLCRIIIFGFILLFLAACGATDEEESSQDKTDVDTEESTAVEEEEESVEVDKGILNVEVTLPGDFFEEEDIDEIIASAKEDGVEEVTKNDDGSLTYKMSKKEHKKMIKEMHEDILDSLDEIKNDDEFASIKDISSNKDFTEFKITIDVAAYEDSFDGFAMIGLAMSGMYYQLFDGVNADSIETKVILEDEDTGEVYNEVVYPEALDDMEQ